MYQIRDENDEHMELLESLLNFTVRSGSSTFMTGSWLKTLTLVALNDLSWQIKRQSFCSLQIAQKAYQLETCKTMHEIEEDKMILIYQTLELALKFERLRRKGCLEFEGEISINPDKPIRMRLTESGAKLVQLKTN